MVRIRKEDRKVRKSSYTGRNLLITKSLKGWKGPPGEKGQKLNGKRQKKGSGTGRGGAFDLEEKERRKERVLKQTGTSQPGKERKGKNAKKAKLQRVYEEKQNLSDRKKACSSHGRGVLLGWRNTWKG